MIRNNLASVFVILVVMPHFSKFRFGNWVMETTSSFVGGDDKFRLEGRFGSQSGKGRELKGVLCKREDE
jgi:hypothetical protein